MNTFVMQHLRYVVTGWKSEAGIATKSWAVPLEPHLTTVVDGDADRRRATPIKAVGSRKESDPAKHLDRVWPDTGPDGIV
jgi:hypothetical protein